MIEAYVDMNSKQIRFYGVDQNDGIPQKFNKNKISSNMNEKDIKKILKEKFNKKIEIFFI